LYIVAEFVGEIGRREVHVTLARHGGASECARSSSL
jgi:hypothetical protein